MYATFHFIIVVTFFHTVKCYIRARDNEMKSDEIENNMKIIMKPIKKLSGIFPNHDIEVQFDIKQTQYYRPAGQIVPRKLHKESKLDDVAYVNSPARTNAFKGLDIIAKGENNLQENNKHSSPLPIKPLTGAFNKDLIYGIRRSNDATTNSTSTLATSARTLLSSSLDPDKQVVYIKDLKNALEELEKKLVTKNCNQQEMKDAIPLSSKISLGNILNTLKQNEPLQREISKPSDEELSWLKIKLPV